MQNLMQCHGQRIVAARRAACADAQPDADTDEQRANDGSDKRRLRQRRPERIELLKNRVECRKTAARDDGVEDKGLPQRFPSCHIAKHIENQP